MEFNEVFESLADVAESGLPFWLVLKSGDELYCKYDQGFVYAKSFQSNGGRSKLVLLDFIHEITHLLPCY
jgi:hypothetical protein